MAESTDSSLTPEKRLLELIEEPDAHKREVTAETKKRELKDILSPAAFQEKFEALKTQGAALFKVYQKAFGIKELNRVLKSIVILLCVVFLISLVMDLAGLGEDFGKSIQVPEGKMFEVEPSKEASAASTTVENWNLGKLFMPYGKRQEDASKIQKEQSTRLSEMTKKLKLTGISYDPANPQKAFCMIEDVEKNITTFLREGDPIGLLKVNKIYEDRVVLGQGSEIIELR